MATSDIIAIVLVIAVVIAVIGYFSIKSNGKRNRIKSLIKRYPSFALTLLNCEKLPPISLISEEQSAKILSLSDSDWAEWESLYKGVRSLAEKYPHTLYDFINSSFPKCKERVNYNKGVKLFSPIPQKVKVAVASLLLEELRKIDADPEKVWKERDALRLYATNIRQKYPEGYKSYCIVHNDKSPKDSVVVNNKKHIAELQKLYDESKAYEGWEKKQEDFCSKFWQILKDVRSQDGRYTYDVSFNKPTRKGTLIESKFKVWQGFCESFSSHLTERQADKFKKRFSNLSYLKNRTIHFYDHVYDGIFEIINRFKDTALGDIYVVFINKSERGWPSETYNYHYNYLRKKLDDEGIPWFDFTNLPNIIDDGQKAGLLFIDLITSNDELKRNCKFIIEHFSKSVPLIGYYSMEKDYDEEELLKIAENEEGYLMPLESDSELDDLPFEDDEKENENDENNDITFIREQILLVNKASRFSYIAIPNGWIGRAIGAESTKRTWLNNPDKYVFRTNKKPGVISGDYSIDGGVTYKELSIEGDLYNVNEVAQYTYLLFKKMGVLHEFKKNGHKAVAHMNENGYFK